MLEDVDEPALTNSIEPEEQAVLFRTHRKAALATLDKDGFPHVVAMNYFVKDGDFYMTS